MLPRRYRLRRRLDVQRVRRQGRRWRHPLAILFVLPAEQGMNKRGEALEANLSNSRFAFSASKRVGNAVSRNRTKRLLRAAVCSHLNEIDPGWDCLVVARTETLQANFGEVETAVESLLSRAQLLSQSPHGGRS